MDTLSPGRAWRKREDQTVARKTYSEEFRRDAVELYRTTPGATVVGIAADLGIMDGARKPRSLAAARLRSTPPVGHTLSIAATAVASKRRNSEGSSGGRPHASSPITPVQLPGATGLKDELSTAAALLWRAGPIT